MAEITEPTKAQKEEIAYARIVRILRGQGLTQEEIEEHQEVVNHPGRPTREAIATATAARVAAVEISRDEAKGPAQGTTPKKGSKKAEPVNEMPRNVPIVDASAGPALGKLPEVMNGNWEDETAGNQEGKA